MARSLLVTAGRVQPGPEFALPAEAAAVLVSRKAARRSVVPERLIELARRLRVAHVQAGPPFRLLDVLADRNRGQTGIRYLSVHGEGPFDTQLFERLVAAAGWATIDEQRKIKAPYCVLGKSLEEDDLRQVLRERNRVPTRFFSQELFLAWLLSGRDPFTEPARLRGLSAFYPQLDTLLRRCGFNWPNTPLIVVEPGSGSLTLRERSFLKRLGYTVGEKGLSCRERRAILAEAYSLSSSALSDRIGLRLPDDWGEQASNARLAKIAYLVAFFINTRKTKRDHLDAVVHWREDLRWLKEAYYDGDPFRWPPT